MKKLKQYLYLLVAVFALSSCSQQAPAIANEWKPSVIPASLNSDNTIRLVGGITQELAIALQADEEVTSRSDIHDIKLEFDLPQNVSIVGNGGSYQFSLPTKHAQHGRKLVTFDVQVKNSAILGAPGSRLASEWKNHSIFVEVPQSVPVGQSYLRLKIEEGDYSETFSWPLKIDNFAPPAQRPKHTPLGLWDYSYSRANNEIAAKGIAALFRHSGISFTSKASGTVYRDALQTAGIKTGGYTHHGYFSNKKFPDPQAVISAPASALIPGVKQLVSNAKNGNGIASMDYEPTGRSGFNASAISKFKQRYNVSEADFTQFRDYVAKHRLETFKATDPLIQKIWKQWTEFRTKQTEEYISRLHEEFQKQMPNGRLLITSSRSYGKDSLRTLALGCDNAAMAQYADIMMPQIYCGYGGAAAKLAMQMTHGWKQEIKKQGSKSQLWPLLLVRYAGAKSGNSPQRLRQQIIGSLAHGADGISLYFPGIMDATYWKMLARTTEDIAKYEDYYQSGKRVSDAFSLNGLPQGIVQVNMWPDYNETVKNPGWSFTAHQLGSKVLLTLINLQEANDLVFDINIGKTKVLSSQNTEKSGNHQWLVAPGQIGFIMLEGE